MGKEVQKGEDYGMQGWMFLARQNNGLFLATAVSGL